MKKVSEIQDATGGLCGEQMSSPRGLPVTHELPAVCTQLKTRQHFHLQAHGVLKPEAWSPIPAGGGRARWLCVSCRSFQENIQRRPSKQTGNGNPPLGGGTRNTLFTKSSSSTQIRCVSIKVKSLAVPLPSPQNENLIKNLPATSNQRSVPPSPGDICL